MLDAPLLVVCHDAGGAEVVAAWLRRHSQHAFACVAEGPACQVFGDSAFRSMQSCSKLQALDRLAEFRTVLTSTSWASDLEMIFVDRGRQVGARTLTYLDHWTDYRGRFMANGRLVLPHEIWVGDEHAERMAKAIFPDQKIRNVGNWYLAEIAESVRAASRRESQDPGRKRVLFVSEPLSASASQRYGNPRYFGYTEHEAVAAFLKHANDIWASVVESIRIRRHPSEAPGKFSSVVRSTPGLPVVECGDAPLVEDCSWADWIVGCQSMALVVGLLAGKKVFSAIPSYGRPSAIPYPGIIPLFQPQQTAPDISGVT